MPKNDKEIYKIYQKYVGAFSGPVRYAEVKKLWKNTGFRGNLLDSYTCDNRSFSPLHAAVIKR